MEEGSMTPNDPLFPLQWYLKNTGQAGGTPGIDINVEKVWDDYNGAGVTVGVYDDGVETEGPNAHPDLVERYDPALEPLFLNGSVNGQPLSDQPGKDSHGTAVAGIIAASTNNDLGVAGIAFGATFGTVKVLDLSPTAPSVNALLTTLPNFDVTNHSWGSNDAFILAAAKTCLKRPPGPDEQAWARSSSRPPAMNDSLRTMRASKSLTATQTTRRPTSAAMRSPSAPSSILAS